MVFSGIKVMLKYQLSVALVLPTNCILFNVHNSCHHLTSAEDTKQLVMGKYTIINYLSTKHKL